MLQGALFAGKSNDLGFLGGANKSGISSSMAFVKSISGSACFLVLDFLVIDDSFSIVE